MSIPVSKERKILTEAEFEAVRPSHYPDLRDLSRDDLIGATKRIREYRDKARDVSRQQRREMRGKADPRGSRSAADNSGTLVKKQVLSGALKRLNKEIRRRRQAERRESQGDIARRALELRRANRVRHHPGAGRTAGTGMRSTPNEGPTVETDPREIGRVSRFVQDAQARRDSR
jgi:hypothetical protein